MQTTALLTAIDEEITRLQRVKALLSGTEVRRGRSVRSDTRVGNGLAARKKRVMSPEARKRIADAQRKRWAAQKKAGK